MSREKHERSPTSANASSNDLKRRKTNEAELEQDPDLPQGARDLDLTAPPLSNINDIFSRLTFKAFDKDFKGDTMDDVIAKFVDRPLRVATMCSGTESPILALQLIQKSLARAGKPNIQFEHVFSAEIEPFKQAYIQRNFSPPLLFQDITEFKLDTDGTMQGLTAFGATQAVPDNIDILVAGSSCTQFSSLNNLRTGSLTDREGKSTDTFKAVLRYVKHAKPSIVILENVNSKDDLWAQFEKLYRERGYATKVKRVDTKNYYIPHTRTRRYMLGLNKEIYDGDNTELLEAWADYMKKFEGRASAPVTSFLLPAEDPRVHSLAAWDEKKVDDLFKPDTRWEAARELHKKFRLEHNLGPGKPISSPSQCPEHGHRRWLDAAPCRERDLIDIRHLLQASENDIDTLFKTRTMDIGQAVDRTDSNSLGIAGCVAPQGKSYVTDAVRLLNGYEALILQGIPVDEVSFTTESNRDLKDLAGNAMTSTVVGAALLSALLIGFEKLGTIDHSSIPKKEPVLPNKALMRPEAQKKFHSQVFDCKALLADARNSAQQCYCEGLAFVSKSSISNCEHCGQSICGECKGSPSHDYRSNTTLSRTNPESFLSKWASKFPLRIQLNGAMELHPQHKESFTQKFGVDAYVHLQKAFLETCVFEQIHRQKIWTICYRSPTARLELVLSETPEWRIFISPPVEMLKNRVARNLLKSHVARARVDISKDSKLCIVDSNLQWESRIPTFKSVDVVISGKGPTVKSWRAELGLKNFAKETVLKTLEIQLKPGSDLDSDIGTAAAHFTGSYALLPNCGTAFRSLYKRDQVGTLPVYLFFDPDPIGKPSQDRFVFAHSCHRLDFGQHRDILASILPGWRPWKLQPNEPSVGDASTDDASVEDVSMLEASVDADLVGETSVGQKFGDEVSVELTGVWKDIGRFSMKVIDVDIDFKIFDPAIPQAEVFQPVCPATSTLLTASFSLPAIVPGCPITEWAQDASISLNNNSFFKTFPDVFKQVDLSALSQWEDITFLQNERCEICSSPPLPVKWTRTLKSQMAINDKYLDTANYERKMNARPQAIAVGLKVLDNATKQSRVVVSGNIKMLAHQAIMHLRHISPATAISAIHWRLKTGVAQPATLSLPNFRNSLVGNEGDEALPQIDGLTLGEGGGLFQSQLKSLSWMKKQEKGVQFNLEHYEEAVLPPVGWRLEVKALSPIHVKGGVLADAPSYGKTITTLALIYDEFKNQSRESIINLFEHASTHHIPTAATLIVTPGHLIQQWRKEIENVLPKNEYGTATDKVIKIETMNDLKKCTIEQFEKAKIVLVSAELLTRDTYRTRTAEFAALAEPQVSSTAVDTRVSRLWLEHALEKVRCSVSKLQKSSISEFANWNSEQREQNIRNLPPLPDNLESTKNKKDAMINAAPQQAQDVKADTDQDPQDSGDDQKDSDDQEDKNLGGSEEYHSYVRPLFHMFRWNRLVIDEFALSTIKPTLLYTSMVGLDADKRWILSGTPPLDDFHDVQLFARLIGVNLGIDSFHPGITSADKIRTFRKQFTNVEWFQAYQEKRSVHWHARRHHYARRFLSTFVRQNQVDLSNISAQSFLIPVTLEASHRAVYNELNFYTASVGERMRPMTQDRPAPEVSAPLEAEKASGNQPASTDKPAKNVKSAATGTTEGKSNSQESSLKDCETIEHALLRSTSAFSTSLQDLVSCREGQMNNLIAAVIKALHGVPTRSKNWLDQQKKDGEKESQSTFTVWRLEKSGDSQTDKTLKPFVKAAMDREGISQDDAKFAEPKGDNKDLNEAGDDEGSEGEGEGDDDVSETEVDGTNNGGKKTGQKGSKKVQSKEARKLEKELKDAVLNLRGLTREMVSRHRSLRYIQAVQTLLDDPPVERNPVHCDAKECAHYHNNPLPPSETRILSPCGHILCHFCVKKQPINFDCIADDCHAEIVQDRIQGLENFGSKASSTSRSFGAKLDRIVSMLHNIDTNEQAVLFVQDDYMAAKAQECLTEHKITNKILYSAYKTMTGYKNSAISAQGIVERFKAKKSKLRVLIICLDSDHVTGLNLTTANHVFFLAPYHAVDQHEYESKMLQSIRRCHRIRQENPVNVYRFIALDTIDVNVIQDRERRLVEPLWENPSSEENIISSAKPDLSLGEEESQLVKLGEKYGGTDGKERFVLASKKWLRSENIVLTDNYSTNVALSSCYDHFEDHYKFGDLLEEENLN